MAALAAPAVLAERAAIAALVAPAAVGQPGRAALVVSVLRAPAALVAVVALAVPASMRAASPMVQLVVMPDKAAPVAWAALRAHRAPTQRRWSAALAGSAVTPVLRAKARRVSAA
jgi:hypothetical protein